jgi:hypothetical protein
MINAIDIINFYINNNLKLKEVCNMFNCTSNNIMKMIIIFKKTILHKLKNKHFAYLLNKIKNNKNITTDTLIIDLKTEFNDITLTNKTILDTLKLYNKLNNEQINISINKSNDILVMTYNVYNKALNGTKEMSSCIKNNTNICIHNMVKWLTIDSKQQISNKYNIKNQYFDIIMLQEVSYIKHWVNIKQIITKYDNNFFYVYDDQIHTTNKLLANTGLITLYNKLKYVYIKKFEFLLTTGGRPCIFLLLKRLDITNKKYIVCINSHFPHINQYNITNKIILFLDYFIQENKIKTPDIIWGGDFNYTPGIPQTNIFKINNKITNNFTCCDKYGKNSHYMHSSDHIFTNIKHDKRNRLIGDMSIYKNTNNGNSFISDHLPVMLVI